VTKPVETRKDLRFPEDFLYSSPFDSFCKPSRTIAVFAEKTRYSGTTGDGNPVDYRVARDLGAYRQITLASQAKPNPGRMALCSGNATTYRQIVLAAG
jgi:hypothetical protein